MDGEREGQSREDFDSQIIGTERGTVKAGEFVESVGTLGGDAKSEGAAKPKVKAVLFVSDGVKVEPELDIQVVSIDPAGLNAIVARRC